VFVIDDGVRLEVTRTRRVRGWRPEFGRRSGRCRRGRDGRAVPTGPPHISLAYGTARRRTTDPLIQGGPAAAAARLALPGLIGWSWSSTRSTVYDTDTFGLSPWTFSDARTIGFG